MFKNQTRKDQESSSCKIYHEMLKNPPMTETTRCDTNLAFLFTTLTPIKTCSKIRKVDENKLEEARLACGEPVDRLEIRYGGGFK